MISDGKPMDNDTRGISMSAAKFVYRQLVEAQDPHLEVVDLVEKFDLWLADEWTHVGSCIVVCLQNDKLVESFQKGNVKILEALIGKTIKLANKAVDAQLIRELMPLIISFYWGDTK
jgi:Asp-tRNA(Asn)/Glu-tRNA(Gln) amidotransferase B subunit